MTLQPITMTLGTGTINERLSAQRGEYQRQPVATCELCGVTLYSRVGAQEHAAAHEAGELPYGTVTKYYVTMAHLPAFRAESKAELWKGLERSE